MKILVEFTFDENWEKDYEGTAEELIIEDAISELKDGVGWRIIEQKQPQKATIEQRKEKFAELLQAFEPEFGINMINDFFNYWTEHGPNDRKMRFEKEKSFGLTRRLATWKRNQERYEANRKNYSNRFESDTTRRTIENFRQRVEQKG